MARREQDREDLFREATTYPLRGELVSADSPDAEVLFVGIKPDGAWACYFGADPVYQFTARGELRRAYRNGELYRTQGTTLARMQRIRSPHETTLARQDLQVDELNEFLTQLHTDITRLHKLCLAETTSIPRALPDAESFRAHVQAACEQALSASTPLAPRIPGKR